MNRLVKIMTNPNSDNASSGDSLLDRLQDFVEAEQDAPELHQDGKGIISGIRRGRNGTAEATVSCSTHHFFERYHLVR